MRENERPRGLLRFLSCLTHLVSADCQYEIVDFRHVILGGNRFRGTWVRLKKRRVTKLRLVKQIFDGRQRKRRATIYNKRSLILLSDLNSKDTNRISYRYYHFSIFLKSTSVPSSTRGQNTTAIPIWLKFRR